MYEGFCSKCGTKLVYKIGDKYPAGIDRVKCFGCDKEFNVKFVKDDNEIMILELREIKI